MLTNTYEMKNIFNSEKWGLRETIVITSALFLTGIVLQIAVPIDSVGPLKFPYTALSALVAINILVLVFFGFRQSSAIQWLSSVPAAIASISYLGALTLAMGFVKQDPGSGGILGIHTILGTWYFIFAMIFFLTSLGMAALKRMVPFKWRNVGFLLNHLGLWIAVFAGIVGSSDMLTLAIPLDLHSSTNVAYDQTGTKFELPFTLRLEKFDIEEYSAEPLVAEIGNEANFGRPQKKDPANDSVYHFGNIEIVVHIRMMNAYYRDSTFIPIDTAGGCQAMKITATDRASGICKQGWISNSNSPAYITLNKYAIALSAAEPKRFSSLVRIQEKDKPADTVIIEVNKPHKIGALYLYQYSYDSTNGRWSNKSVLQAVYDPWLKLVYIGLFMVIAGSLHLLFTRDEQIGQTNTEQL